MSSPLNPALYNRLRAEFGRVQIAHEGCAATVVHEHTTLDGRLRANFVTSGEYYRVNCPYCNDMRGRLWVNHCWGVYDEITCGRNLWLAICYNEDCMATVGRPFELYDRLYSMKNANVRGQPNVILPGIVESATLNEVKLPGLVLRLDRLPVNDPVCNYLRSRDLDPVELGQTYGAAYCLEANHNYPMAQGRIVIPIIMHDMIVGWQCRYAGDVDFKRTGIPKYYSLPTMPKRLMLYNFDIAKQSPYVVVCEGPTDVWNVGPQAVAMFGKHMSAAQMNLIGRTWEDGVIIILLDGDAWEDTEALTKNLRTQLLSSTVIPVQLPADKDPGDLSCKLLWEYIQDEVSRYDIDLLTLQRKTKIDDYKQIKHDPDYPGRVRRLSDEGRVVEAERGLPNYSFDSPRDAAGGA